MADNIEYSVRITIPGDMEHTEMWLAGEPEKVAKSHGVELSHNVDGSVEVRSAIAAAKAYMDSWEWKLTDRDNDAATVKEKLFAKRIGEYLSAMMPFAQVDVLPVEVTVVVKRTLVIVKEQP